MLPHISLACSPEAQIICLIESSTARKSSLPDFLKRAFPEAVGSIRSSEKDMLRSVYTPVSFIALCSPEIIAVIIPDSIL